MHAKRKIQKNKITSWKVWHQEDFQHHMSSKDFLYSIASLSKYLPQAWEKSKSKIEKERRVGDERFWHGNNTESRCVKWGRGGFLLYLRAKSYPSWMSYKCHTSKRNKQSQRRVTFRVLVVSQGLSGREKGGNHLFLWSNMRLDTKGGEIRV